MCALAEAEWEAADGSWDRLGGSSKLRALVRLLSSLPVTDKAVIFTLYNDMVPTIGAFLEQHHLGAISLKESRWWDASVRGVASPVEAFATTPRCRALVLQADASAAGLTLTCAQHVVFFDVLNSPLLESQAKARVARIGQTAPTTVWHLVATDTVDELLRDVADRGWLLQEGSASSASVGWILKTAEARAAAAAVAAPPPIAQLLDE